MDESDVVLTADGPSTAIFTEATKKSQNPPGALRNSWGGRLRSSKIMIIDDEPTTVRIVRKYLQEVGYFDFVTTSDPADALDMIRNEAPDILILDVMMPGVSGLEVLELIRGEDDISDLPVIILTASSDRETKMKAMKLGATDFLAKPVDSNELSLRIRNVISIKSHQATAADSMIRGPLRYKVREGRDIPVSLTTTVNGHTEEMKANLDDLSIAGAKLAVESMLEVDQEIAITIIAPEVELDVTVNAITRWLRAKDDGQWYVGCSFCFDLPKDVLEGLVSAGYIDRRIDDRWKISMDALLQLEMVGDKSINVSLEDYSPGGFQVYSPQPIKVGERVLIQVRKSDGDLARIPGRTIWQVSNDEGFIVGCGFLNNAGFAELCRLTEPPTSGSQLLHRQLKLLQEKNPIGAILWLGVIGAILWCLSYLELLS